MQRSAAFGKRGSSQHRSGRSAAAPRRKPAAPAAAAQSLPTYQELLALENPDAVPAPDPRMAYEPQYAAQQPAAMGAAMTASRPRVGGKKSGNKVLVALSAIALCVVGFWLFYRFTG